MNPAQKAWATRRRNAAEAEAEAEAEAGLSATAKEWASRARNVEEMKPTTGKRADLAKVDKAATKRWAARKDEREARHARLMQRVDRLKGTK